MSYKFLPVALMVAITMAILVGGCAPERHEVVPSTAIFGAEGNQQLTYTSDGPGTVYVFDQPANKLLYRGHLTRRQQVKVDPERNEITVDGTLVAEKNLQPGNHRKIFFHPTVR